MKIEMGKKYRTRSGVAVRILAVDLDVGIYTVAGFIKGSGLYSYTSDGKFSISYSPHPEDLVEVCEWDDFKIDDKVMVGNIGISEVWHKQHFAGVNYEGKPMTFAGGGSSWTKLNELTAWDECRRPTDEELK